MKRSIANVVRPVFVLAAVLTAAPAHSAPIGVIETPVYNSTQTGVGLISGWQCGGQNIEIRIDDGPLQPVGAHTSREDTRAVCGRSDTGYGFLFNYNLLSLGRHSLVAFADGVGFAQQEFSTFTLPGGPVSGTFLGAPLLNLPRLGVATTVMWDPEIQDFRASSVATAPSIDGDYYGATMLVNDCNGARGVGLATYSVTFDAGMMGVAVRYSDGSTMTFPPAPAQLQVDGYIQARFPGEWVLEANGEVLSGEILPPLDDPCHLNTRVRAVK